MVKLDVYEIPDRRLINLIMGIASFVSVSCAFIAAGGWKHHRGLLGNLSNESLKLTLFYLCVIVATISGIIILILILWKLFYKKIGEIKIDEEQITIDIEE
jgi:TRAP-type C4-dicarboxylate transport system permease small subunit